VDNSIIPTKRPRVSKTPNTIAGSLAPILSQIKNCLAAKPKHEIAMLQQLYTLRSNTHGLYCSVFWVN